MIYVIDFMEKQTKPFERKVRGKEIERERIKKSYPKINLSFYWVLASRLLSKVRETGKSDYG